MTDKTYRQAFEQAKIDLARATTRKNRALIDANKAQEESIQLRRAITALATLCGENVEDSIGLTEAVRMLFETRKTSLSLKEIKEQAEALGVGLSDLKNPDASVLSVLNRLTTAQELLPGTKKAKNPVTGAVVDIKVWQPNPNAKPSAKAVAVADEDMPF